jgi:quinol monooxygenase YgiN
VTASYAVVALVILMADPVIGKFDATLPDPDHYDLLPRVLTGGAHFIAVATLVAGTAVTARRTRDRDPEALDSLVPIALFAGAAVLLAAAMGGYLPGVLTVLAVAIAAGVVWYGARRALYVAAGGEEDEYDEYEDAEAESGGFGRSGYELRGPGRSTPDRTPKRTPDRPAERRPERRPDRYADRPAAAQETSGDMRASRSSARESSKAAPSDAYGHITVSTLREGREAAFDRLTEEAVRAVRDLEPNTFIFACHVARNAPNQRVFYQLYRDRMAYQEHERQPHIQHFLAEGSSHIRTTKVIELKLGPAKVVPPR